MSWPNLPSRAAYLAIRNGKKRNALSLSVLRDLKKQLHAHNTSPVDGRLRLLPPFKPELLNHMEAISHGRSTDWTPELTWLLDTQTWRNERENLPNVIVLRTEGDVFSSGHDLKEIRTLSNDEVKETFALCAEVMSLIRRSPAPVVGVIQGLATAAGAQLALSTDLPITTSSTCFQLPSASIGLPCTSPSTALSRRLGPALTYRMLSLAEKIPASDLPPGTLDIVPDIPALDQRVADTVAKLADENAAQPQALGKWAFWTQFGFRGGEAGDGYEEAARWAGRMMALHARADDAREGIAAFFEKRQAKWRT